MLTEKQVLRKSSLTGKQAGLLELMQRINFGWIEQLVIKDSEPVLAPSPRVTREVKFGSETGPRHEIEKTDFELKAQARELFEAIDRLQNGKIMRLEIKHGLPFRMIVAEEVL